VNAPFILCGHDFEGETREIGCNTLEQARKIAKEMMAENEHPAWKDFAIWGNHPETENWEALETAAANRNLKACECDAFQQAQTSGTDNEGYGGLIRGRSIGCGLPEIKFCPWCGGNLPLDKHNQT